MKSLSLLTAVLAAAAAALVLPVASGAASLHARSGDVQATLTYSTTSEHRREAGRLTIVRNGTTLLDEQPRVCGSLPCEIGAFRTEPALRVRNLDGDPEPEVLFTGYSGGAHCCTVVRLYDLKADASGYRELDHNFGDPGFRLRDLGSNGTTEWVTADDRFAYAFTAYAFSGLPIQILRFENGRLRNVTNRFRGRVRKDGARWLHIYRRVRHRSDGTALGAVSAWAANEYRLGKRTAVLRFLRREARAGRLRGPDLHGRRFITKLDRFLRHAGYAR